MIEGVQQLEQQYTAALEMYLQGEQDRALKASREISRQAAEKGIGIGEVVAAQFAALAALARSHGPSAIEALSADAFPLFAEVFSASEDLLRDSREPNGSLRTNLQKLEAGSQGQHQDHEELATAQRRLYQELLHLAPAGYVVTDLEGRIQEVNESAAHVFGAEVTSERWLPELATEGERAAVRRQIERLKSGETGQIQACHLSLQGRTGQFVPVSLLAEAIRDDQGRPVALRWLITDMTERQRLEEESAQLRIREHLMQAERQAAQRMKFLAEASAVLAISLDCSTIVSSIARLAVPYLADFCVVHLAEDAGSVQQVSAAHADPEHTEAAQRLERYWMRRKQLPANLARVLETSESELVTDVSVAWLEQFAQSVPALEILQRMGLVYFAVVPMSGHNRPLGTITLARSASRAAFGNADQYLADDFARRCSLVMHNAILHSQVVVERDRAAKVSRAKDEFVAVLSHELRTPLTGILGWARVLKKQAAIQSEPLLNEGLCALEHNARNIARLVEDCLDITRIAQRKITLQPERLDLNSVLRSALEPAREAALQKKLHWLVHLSQEPLCVLGDRTRLEQVFSNLLSNAVRYTAEDGKISVVSRRAGAEALISIEDTGIGIDPESLDQIFQPFRQGTQQWLESESGLGLGLAISRELVRMHGGAVWAESQGTGYGSSFYVRLPLTARPAHSAGPAVPAAVAQHAAAGTARVLVVEDCAEILNLLRMELSAEGFSILTANDAKAGLEIARQERPDAVVSDIKMPGVDGYEFMQRLRQIPELASVPAVALTGFGMKRDVERALAAGYNAHLCKPVEMEQLKDLIRELISRRQFSAYSSSPPK